jgi:hypothetical protein
MRFFLLHFFTLKTLHATTRIALALICILVSIFDIGFDMGETRKIRVEGLGFRYTYYIYVPIFDVGFDMGESLRGKLRFRI